MTRSQFSKHANIPIVLVEESAMHWMDVRASPEEVNITSPSPAASRCFNADELRISTY
jgi:putative SOS response-associated peptidase YedK